MGGAGEADGEGGELSDQPWGGRFGEEPDPLIDRFTRSLAVDSRLYREDIAGSRAYAKALVGAGVLTPDEQSRIDQALQEIWSGTSGKEALDGAKADVDAHMKDVGLLK